MKKFSYLGLLTLFLVGCGGNTSTTNKTSSSSSFSEAISSSSSLGPVSYELTDDMLAELEYGYSVDGLYSATIKNKLVSTFYYEYNCTANVYEYTSYQEVVENPTKKTIEDSYRYEGYDYGNGVLYLSLAKLNLGNEVVNYPVTDGYGSYLTWDSTGFANAFTSMKASLFEESENEFEFDLNMNLLTKQSLYASLTSQFSSYMGLKAKSFTLRTDGYKIVGYKMTYQPLATTGGQMDITCEGVFTNYGEDVVKPVQPFEGEANDLFDEKFEELRDHTYKVKVELGVKSYDLVVENAEGIIYDEYDSNGNKTSSYGFIQVRDGVLQGITKINDKLYIDGGYGAGSLLDILPTLNVSSELFVLVEEKDGKSVFKYNEKAPKVQEIGYNYDYGIFGGSAIGDLTITISEDEVVVENKLKYNTEKFTYYNINKVKRYFNVNESCDNLKWSDILSNQEKEVEKLYKVIPQDALDQIPTVGGINARVDLDATYKPKEPVITVPLYIDGTTLYNTYRSKLIDSGFALNEELMTDDKEVFTKDYEINGESKTIVVKIYLAQDYLSGSQFLIYPSII